MVIGSNQSKTNQESILRIQGIENNRKTVPDAHPASAVWRCNGIAYFVIAELSNPNRARSMDAVAVATMLFSSFEERSVAVSSTFRRCWEATQTGEFDNPNDNPLLSIARTSNPCICSWHFRNVFSKSALGLFQLSILQANSNLLCANLPYRDSRPLSRILSKHDELLNA